MMFLYSPRPVHWVTRYRLVANKPLLGAALHRSRSFQLWNILRHASKILLTIRMPAMSMDCPWPRNRNRRQARSEWPLVTYLPQRGFRCFHIRSVSSSARSRSSRSSRRCAATGSTPCLRPVFPLWRQSVPHLEIRRNGQSNRARLDVVKDWETKKTTQATSEDATLICHVGDKRVSRP